ncbi:MAG: hypothetical protein VKJ46_15545 [Leptolyngbyaceae bacterium]|nr:hypothetical protein [Leptolyngbyaceae bacterium]
MNNISGFSQGIPTGLKVALFFLIGFSLLGYPAFFSLFLAIVGGIASGFIVHWWQAKEIVMKPSPPNQNAEPSSTDPPTEVKMTRAERWRKNQKRRKPRRKNSKS